MGGSSSKPEKRNRKNSGKKSVKKTNEILQRKPLRIALLGTGESGKTTILRQMKIIYQGGFQEQERASYRKAVFLTCVESIAQVVEALEAADTKFISEDAANAVKIVKNLKNIKLEFVNSSADFPLNVADAIKCLWFKCNVRAIASKLSALCYIMDSAPYFLDNIDRIAGPGYIPSQNDLLKARTKTPGISSDRFTLGCFDVMMTDVGGQRRERRKWNQIYDDDIIIFCVSLSEYDQTLLEFENQNRMLESLELFKNVINSRYIKNNTPIVLFLNKFDILGEKIKYSKPKKFFPDFTGNENDEKTVAEYFKSKFSALVTPGIKLFVHFTNATDTNQMEYLFGVLQETVMVRSLQEKGCF